MAAWFKDWVYRHAAAHRGVAPDPRSEAGAHEYRTLSRLFDEIGITEADANAITAGMCFSNADSAAHMGQLTELARSRVRHRQTAADAQRYSEAAARAALEERQRWETARARWQAMPETDRQSTLSQLTAEHPDWIRTPRWLEAMALVSLMDEPTTWRNTQ